jgi:hypothetical protein
VGKGSLKDGEDGKVSTTEKTRESRRKGKGQSRVSKRRRKDKGLEGNARQKQRVCTALIVSAVFVFLLVFLAIQQSLERSAAAPNALSYLVTESEPIAADPLGIASESLELVGVSSDGLVIGYATDGTVAQTMVEVDQAMRVRGWLAIEMNTDGISSYVWQGGVAQETSTQQMAQETQESSISQTSQMVGVSQGARAYVMFICNERDGGSSVVAELL